MELKSRILIVDDNKSIHEDIKKILSLTISNNEIDNFEELLFEEKKKEKKAHDFVIDDAYQGEEAIDLIEKSALENYPYSMAFMDVRMPPGIDGIETIHRIWEKYPNIEMVICTAYSDYSWDDIIHRFGYTDQLLFMKKPFDAIALKQITYSLTTKWKIAQKNREYMAYLETEVKKRTYELTKLMEYMRDLKEKAEESDRLKSAFLSNMSHEIRTPMNAIVGFAAMLKKENISKERTDRYITYINNGGKVLLQLIDDIIDISKIEAKQLKLFLSNCPINELLNELKEFFEQQTILYEKPNIKIILKIGHNNPKLNIFTDPLRIKQVISNLIGNALKFTTEGTIEFGYTIENGFMKFYVKDTGIGIPDDKCDIIFERFGQVEETALHNKRGTGLGLAISRNIIELLGGKIWVESEINIGSKFTFTIPFKQVEISECNTDGEQIVLQNNRSLHGKKVLVADDEEINYIFFYELLSTEKIEVIWAKDGKEALNIILTHDDLDLILLDIKMPEMTGIEVMQNVRSLTKKLPPIIAQTAFTMSDERIRYIQAGFDDFISKPINIEQFFEKINYWIFKDL